MNYLPADNYETDLSWNAIALESRPAMPSWLAPPLESSTFPVVEPPVAVVQAATGDEIVEMEPPAMTAEPTPIPAPISPAALAYPDLRDENAALRTRLAQVNEAVGEIRRAIMEASEVEMVRLTCAIAERVAGRELTIDPNIVLGWIREASAALTTTDPITLVVSPDLAATVSAVELRQSISGMAVLEVDPALGSMRCEVRTHVATVEASLEARLGVVAEALGANRP